MKVENFTIFNKHGEIQFMGPVDLVEVDLENEIEINPGEIRINRREEDKKGDDAKKLLKSKLDKPAIVSLYDLDNKSLESAKNCCAQFKNLVWKREVSDHLNLSYFYFREEA